MILRTDYGQNLSNSGKRRQSGRQTFFVCVFLTFDKIFYIILILLCVKFMLIAYLYSVQN